MAQLAPRLKQTAISAGLYKPTRWVVDHVINRKRLEARSNISRLLSSFVKPGALCFDVGANIGDYTQALLNIGATVVCVDPQTTALKELRARFGTSKRVTIEPVALGSSPGEATFYLRDHHGASGLYADLGGDSRGTTTVKLDTLENLIQRHGVPHYIKIDVEGHELEVIRGLKTKVPYLSVEYHTDQTDIALKLSLIEHLSRNADLSFNILPQGHLHFVWPEFVDSTTLRSAFPGNLTAENMPPYGDIFIRCD